MTPSSAGGVTWAPPPPSEGTWASPGHQGSGTRATWAQIALGLAIGIIALSAVVILGGYGLIDRIERGLATDAEVREFAQLTEDFGNVTTALQVFAAICVLAWLYRAVGNAPALGRGTPRWKPWQTVAWWFVPVAFLFMPFVVVRDLWRRMSPEGARASSVIVGAWFLLYLGGSVGARFVAAASETVVTYDALRAIFAWTVALLVVVAVSGVLLIWIIRTIEARAVALAAAGAAVLPGAPAWPVGPAGPVGPAWGIAPPASSPGAGASSLVTADPPAAVAPDPPVAPSPSASFCPRCATARVRAMRYCASCAFDFESIAPSA